MSLDNGSGLLTVVLLSLLLLLMMMMVRGNHGSPPNSADQPWPGLRHSSVGKTKMASTMRDHKMALRKRLERARRKQGQPVVGANSVSVDNAMASATSKDDRTTGTPLPTTARTDKRHDKHRPDPFQRPKSALLTTHLAQQVHMQKLEAERVERERARWERERARRDKRKVHLAKTARGQPRLGKQIEALLDRIAPS